MASHTFFKLLKTPFIQQFEVIFSLQEVHLHKGPGERLGISIRGGAKGHPGNPLDKTDEGIFVSKVNEGGVAFKDGRLKVGQRLLEVRSSNFSLQCFYQNNYGCMENIYEDNQAENIDLMNH